MPTCKNCGEYFPVFTKIGNKRVDSRKRVYCLKCNPYKERKFWGGKLTEKSLGISRNCLREHTCPVCGKEHKNKTRNIECFNCKSRKIRNSRKDKACDMKGGKCQICGYDKCRDAFSFHHIDPSKKLFSLASSWEYPWEDIVAEIEKCVLLCCRCHAEVHNGITELKIIAP